MLNSLFSDTTSSLNLLDLLICSIVSVLLGLIIALVHKKTSRYSKNFLITLTTLPLLVQTIIIMVNGNLGTSLAVVGAFGLVRFRSLPGTSKEILSIFFATSVGLATGIGHVFYAILITLLGNIVIIIFTKIKLFNTNNKEKILKITITENLDYSTAFEEQFKKYLKQVELEYVQIESICNLLDLKYRIKLKEFKKEKEFIDKLKNNNGVLKIIISHPLEGRDL